MSLREEMYKYAEKVQTQKYDTLYDRWVPDRLKWLRIRNKEEWKDLLDNQVLMAEAEQHIREAARHLHDLRHLDFYASDTVLPELLEEALEELRLESLDEDEEYIRCGIQQMREDEAAEAAYDRQWENPPR